MGAKKPRRPEKPMDFGHKAGACSKLAKVMKTPGVPWVTLTQDLMATYVGMIGVPFRLPEQVGHAHRVPANPFSLSL